MSRSFARWSRHAALGQAMVPAAVLALLGLVGGLTYHVRSAERSHRATADRALRDYAAFAAWQFSSDVSQHVYQLAHSALHEIDTLFRGPRPRRELPSPDVLLRPRDSTSCDLGRGLQFVFRIDLPDGVMTVAGPGALMAGMREAIAHRLRAVATTPLTNGSGVRMFVDTILGERRAIAWGVVIGAEGVPHAIYGVDGDPAMVSREVLHVVGMRPLLPPSLLKGKALDEVLALRLYAPDGTLLYAMGPVESGTISASEATPADVGALITTAAIPMHAAETLLIGGVPASRLPVLVVVLIVSAILAGIALVQLRRGRELARLRARFVANVSHELRTPLTQISMFSETLVLGRERSSDERQQFLSVIYREARRLSQLVDSVLSFARADAGPRALAAEPRDVAEDVHDAVHTFSPLAAGASASIEIETTAADRAWAMVEPGALRQVMINLLDNAVKFGPDGQLITVRVIHEGTEVVVTVDDQGSGIPAVERERVFEPFAQIDQARGRGIIGAGIGLAVVAELIAAHGGRVWAEDAPGGCGARVGFALPALGDARWLGSDLDMNALYVEPAFVATVESR